MLSETKPCKSCWTMKIADVAQANFLVKVSYCRVTDTRYVWWHFTWRNLNWHGDIEVIGPCFLHSSLIKVVHLLLPVCWSDTSWFSIYLSGRWIQNWFRKMLRENCPVSALSVNGYIVQPMSNFEMYTTIQGCFGFWSK